MLRPKAVVIADLDEAHGFRDEALPICARQMRQDLCLIEIGDKECGYALGDGIKEVGRSRLSQGAERKPVSRRNPTAPELIQRQEVLKVMPMILTTRRSEGETVQVQAAATQCV